MFQTKKSGVKSGVQNRLKGTYENAMMIYVNYRFKYLYSYIKMKGKNYGCKERKDSIRRDS